VRPPLARAPEELQRLLAVVDDVDGVADLGVLQRLDRQTAVELGIVDEQDVDHGAAPVVPATGRRMMNLAPWSGRASARIVPPCRSTTFLQMARPTPVPGVSRRSRRKILKIRSANRGLKPMPS